MQQGEIITMMDAQRVQGIAKVEEIEQLAKKFPYCATFQILKAIGLKEEDSLDFKVQLNRAAIAIQDRSKLYDYIIRANLLQRIEASSEVDKPASMVPSNLTESKTTSTDTAAQSVSQKKVLEDADSAKSDATEAKSNPSTTSSQDAHFKVETLEGEIMREAISHLSEIESDMRLRELEAQPKPDENDEENTTSKQVLSFGDWLLQKDSAKSKKPPVDRQIIDKFIQESPQISPVRKAFFSPSQMGKMSLVEDESFVTETLAKIYEKQGDFKKAANAYKNLKLKFPEKSIYFADLQKKAEDQIK